MINEIMIGLRGTYDLMIPRRGASPRAVTAVRTGRTYALLLSEKETLNDVFQKNNDSNNPGRQVGFPPSRL